MLADPPLSVPVPRIVVPSVKVTVPLGVPEPLGVTVAVNVTDWPKTELVGEATTLVVVVPELTNSVVLPELVVKLLSPL
jgi:hypothetical protein